jgi:hypothetical protein
MSKRVGVVALAAENIYTAVEHGIAQAVAPGRVGLFAGQKLFDPKLFGGSKGRPFMAVNAT